MRSDDPSYAHARASIREHLAQRKVPLDADELAKKMNATWGVLVEAQQLFAAYGFGIQVTGLVGDVSQRRLRIADVGQGGRVVVLDFDQDDGDIRVVDVTSRGGDQKPRKLNSGLHFDAALGAMFGERYRPDPEGEYADRSPVDTLVPTILRVLRGASAGVVANFV